MEAEQNLKLCKPLFALMHVAGVLLTNMHSCMYGSQVVTNFLATHHKKEASYGGVTLHRRGKFLTTEVLMNTSVFCSLL